MVEKVLVDTLQFARTYGFKGAVVISFCPMCNSRDNIVAFLTYYPTDKDLCKKMDWYVLLFPICKFCMDKYEVNEIRNTIYKNIETLLKSGTKIDVRT